MFMLTSLLEMFMTTPAPVLHAAAETNPAHVIYEPAAAEFAMLPPCVTTCTCTAPAPAHDGQDMHLTMALYVHPTTLLVPQARCAGGLRCVVCEEAGALPVVTPPSPPPHTYLSAMPLMCCAIGGSANASPTVNTPPPAQRSLTCAPGA